MTEDLGRRERRRRSTRSALLSSARRLLAEKGPDALTIADVTQAADVGFGTFYGYFDSKEALVDAVVDEVLEELGRRNDALTEGLTDPALVVAVVVRHTVRSALDAPQLAALVAQLGFSGDTRLWQGLHRRIVRDIEVGVKAHRFEADRLTVAPLILSGSMLAILRAYTIGELPEPVDELDRRLAEAVLGALGLDPIDASSIVDAAGMVLAREAA
jgi:AcrR family transcriptional regulator